MKLDDAFERLAQRYPGVFPMRAGMGLTQLLVMIRDLQKDVVALKTIAHTWRAPERAEHRAVSPPPEVLATMDLPELRKLQRISHRVEIREVINAEVRKRIIPEAPDIPAATAPVIAPGGSDVESSDVEWD